MRVTFFKGGTMVRIFSSATARHVASAIVGLLFVVLAGSSFAQTFLPPQTNRVKITIDTSWKYIQGDQPTAYTPTYSEASMTTVHLPHGFSTTTYSMSAQYYRGIGWYRKHFTLSPAWQNRRVTLYFEGAMTVADVWINGTKLGQHLGGFNPFSFDITPYAKFNGTDNIVAVKLDNSYQRQVPPEKPDGSDMDFEMFGGIYRDVHLFITDSVFIPDPSHDWINRFPSQANQGGQYITFPAVSTASAQVKIDSWIKNTTAAAKSLRVVHTLVDSSGNTVQTGEVSGSAAANAVTRYTQTLTVSNPALWFPWKPSLYTVYTVVYNGTSAIDLYKTKIGIRRLRWTQTSGVYCNDQWFKVLGLNRSQGWPFVGYAVPNLQQRRDAEVLKDIGVNFCRMAHYLQDDEFLDACDSVGILTWLEIPGWHCCNTWTADTVWMNRHFDALSSNVRVARNHACVAIWGAGINEGPQQTAFETQLHTRCKAEDSTRPTSMARWTVSSQPYDLFGNNWFEPPLPATNTMNAPMGYLNTEHTGHTFPTWRTDAEQRLIDVSSRHEQMTAQGRERPWCHGSVGWCAFDYNTRIASDMANVFIRPHGTTDLYHIPKFTYYFYKSQCAADNYDGSKHPMVFIQNYNMSTSPADRKIVTNCDTVELFVNGVSQGRKGPSPENTSTRWCAANANANHWWKVDLGSSMNISGTQVMWEFSGKVYRYRIETSSDNTVWTTAADKTATTSTAQVQTDVFSATNVRYVRITVTGLDAGVWASFYDFKVMSGTTNVATGKTASTDSEESGNPASNGNDAGVTLAHPPIIFYGIAFQAGELRAEGRINGVVVATHSVRTPGAAKRIVLTADPAAMQANGADFSRVIATVVDSNGTAVPTATSQITFSVNALGAIIGDNPVNAMAGAVGVLAKGAFTNGTMTVTATATAAGLTSGTADIQLGPMQSAVQGSIPRVALAVEKFGIKVMPQKIRLTISGKHPVTADLLSLNGRVMYSRSIDRAGTYFLPLTTPGVSVLRLRGETQKIVKLCMVR